MARPRGTGYRTVCLTERTGLPTGAYLQIGRALDQAIGCPRRVDLERRADGRELWIRVGSARAVCGRRQSTRPRVTLGDRVAELLGLELDREYSARIEGSAIVVEIPGGHA